MTDIQQRFTYEETEAMVLAYQKDTLGSAERILTAFEGFLVKFVNLVSNGVVNVHHRGQRQFVSLYIANPLTRANLHRFRRSRFARNEIYRITNSIKGFFSGYSYHEILQEATLAILILAKRYKSPDGKPRFHYYIERTFHYQFYRQLQTLVSGPIVFRVQSNQDYDYISQHIETSLNESDDWINKIETASIEENMDEINDNWVNNMTCSDLFNGLSIFERKILKLYYIDDLTDQQIANAIGTCRATINRRRLAVIAKLRGEINV